jgi:hypothetical protein
MKLNKTTFNIIIRKSEIEIAITRIKFDLFIIFSIKLKNNFKKLEQLKKLLNISKIKLKKSKKVEISGM